MHRELLYLARHALARRLIDCGIALMPRGQARMELTSAVRRWERVQEERVLIDLNAHSQPGE